MAAVTHAWYRDVYGGGLPEAAFLASEAQGEAHVRWLCALREVDEEGEAFRRAVCAATEAFAEFGSGEVGGYSIGSFSVRNYENKGTTGEEQATRAALRELGPSGAAFSGVA
jgi:hypothetical protein